MKYYILLLILCCTTLSHAQDHDMDYSKVNDNSKPLEFLLNLLTIHGVPQNQNEGDELSILINHGYCVGFSPKYNQPRWAAYQVSKAKEAVDYQRFPFFVDDTRLPKNNRVGAEGFGGGYDRGHLVPNAAINKQFGKLAQMESFLMSNISPQKAGLNQGVWQKLEAEILNKYCYDAAGKEHIWIITGGIFPEVPEMIKRDNSVEVAIPESFYCIIVRPTRYPYDNPSSAEYIAFIFPQGLPKGEKLDTKYLVTINDIEHKTGLNFFPAFTKSQEKKIENEITMTLW